MRLFKKPKQMSDSEVRDAILKSLTQTEGQNDWYPYVIEVYQGQNQVVYASQDQKTYVRGFTIDTDGTVKLGDTKDEVQLVSNWEPVTMSFSRDEDGVAIWSGKIFQAGEYPDKGVTVTEADLDNIVSNFTPQGVDSTPLKIEHAPSLFDEELSKVTLDKVWRVGTELFGEVRVPKWLDEGLKNVEKKVSVGLDATKRFLRELSLVCNPRVEDACLQKVAFSFTHSPVWSQVPPEQRSELERFAKKDIPAPPSPGTKENNMRRNAFKLALLSLFSLVPEDKRAEVKITKEDIENDAHYEPDQMPDNLPPEFKVRLEEQDRRLRAQENAFVNAAGETFFAKLLAERKVTPAQKANVITAFKAALKADGVSGNVKFSDEGSPVEGEHVKALQGLFAQARPAFSAGEQIPVTGGTSSDSEYDEHGNLKFSVDPKARYARTGGNGKS